MEADHMDVNPTTYRVVAHYAGEQAAKEWAWAQDFYLLRWLMRQQYEEHTGFLC